MYLKALEIQGFKSFPDKTRLTFEKNVTAIVGPNGSGKSNLSDALLWVMGEQRTKSLRSSKMEDVIFGGTEKRSKLGFAQVSLVLDNSEHLFDSDATEIMLTRRYYRSGESEYFINKEACRLKDLNSMLMDTGLGRDGYSIIGQGRIAEIVSNKSTDRRDVFEEAAGISRYRYRKEEAERKLEKTEENLVRITDKLDELEIQVGPLQKQAETAKKYLVLRDELRGCEISAWMETLDKLHTQTENIRLELEQVTTELERTEYRKESLMASETSIDERIHKKDIENDEARNKLGDRQGVVSEIESDIAVLETNIRNQNDSVQRLIRDIEERENRIGELSETIRNGETRVQELRKQLDRENSELSAASNMVEGCRLKIRGREDSVSELNDKAARVTVDVRTMESRIHILSEMEKDYEGYNRSVKVVMRESARGTLRGIHGPVANLIKTDSEMSVAIEIALGAAAQNIVTDDQNCGKAAIELLKRQDGGRATFIPLDITKGQILREVPDKDPGFVGLAYDLIRYDSRYSEIMASLLGRIVIAETMNDATRIARKMDNRVKVVTLDGQVVNPGGSLTGGSLGKNTGIISRANELEQLKKQIRDLREQETRCNRELERARAGLATLKQQLEGAMEAQSEHRSRAASLEAEILSTEKNKGQLEALLVSLSGDSESRKLAVDRVNQETEELKVRLQQKNEKLEKAKEGVAAVFDEIRVISEAKMELERRRTQNRKDLTACNDAILDLERRKSRIENKKASAEMEENNILNKLWDNYELSFDSANAIRQPVENLTALNKQISDLKRQINALGAPNIGAIEEYERVNTRYQFFKTQSDDILKAKKELLDILKEITEQMKVIFVEQFDRINEAFRTTFLELFGGGKAALSLEDPENVLECGIEIKVQPPGKALTNMTLMSGGEKAFVAIALYFAILKVRPTPFCVMDEIEAALDENNVTKYAQYMKRMSENTQFLVITHRRGTMEEADALYGVTMQEKGISSVIPLDLEAAKSTAEN